MATVPDPNLEGVDMGTAALPGRTVLDISILRSLSQRSDLQGLIRFGTHLALIVLTGFLVRIAMPNWYLMIPAMILNGITFVTMFAAMHECVHKTAFLTPRLNEIFGWIAGLLSFYNFHYYRYYHTWHHRFTQDPERDPELMDPKPRNIYEYIWEISGIPNWWLPRPMLFTKLAMGMTKQYAFLPENGRRKVAISAGCQLAIYVVALASIPICYYQGMTYPPALYFFFLPCFLGQPVLRAITLAEHTACSVSDNGLTNTRTTLTSFPIRLLMWNMPFHTEHHLYPSIPFHQLPRAHVEIKEKLVHLSPNYVAANMTIIRSFTPKKLEG